MLDILTRAGSFVAIILLGVVLRKIGFFKQEDFLLLSKITIRITLPASIVANFAGKEMDPTMLVFMLMGLGFGVLYMIVGYLLQLRGARDKKAFFVLNLPGYNIGNFTSPFIQGFLGSTGVVVTSLFDAGNAFICLGSAFGIANMIRSGSGFSLKRLGKTLLTSVPFLCYISMTVINLLGWHLPQPVITFAGIVGNANAFVAMLMLGVGFKLGGKGQIGQILKILIPRYAIAAALAIACYYLLPFSLEARQAVVILVFSPIASAAPAFTGEMEGDTGLSSAVNSISIIISIVIIVTLLSVML